MTEITVTLDEKKIEEYMKQFQKSLTLSSLYLNRRLARIIAVERVKTEQFGAKFNLSFNIRSLIQDGAKYRKIMTDTRIPNEIKTLINQIISEEPDTEIEEHGK